MKSLISKKRLTEEEEEERRTKQPLDSPQIIEANKNHIKPFNHDNSSDKSTLN